MKKSIITMLLLAMATVCTQAQSLYKTVYDKATAVVNNPASSDEEVQISQFKVTALNYITMMVKKRGMTKDSYFYDSQPHIFRDRLPSQSGKSSQHLTFQAH